VRGRQYFFGVSTIGPSSKPKTIWSYRSTKSYLPWQLTAFKRVAGLDFSKATQAAKRLQNVPVAAAKKGNVFRVDWLRNEC
jgi:hypothetical protein